MLIDRPGVPFHLDAETLGQVDLVTIAIAYVTLDPVEGGGVFLAAGVAGQRGAHGVPGQGDTVGIGEQGLQDLPVRRGAVIRHDQPGPASVVVNNHRPVIEAHRHVRHVEVVPGQLGQLFGAAAQVVGKIAQGPAEKREPWQVHPALPQALLEQEKRILRRMPRPLSRGDDGVLSLGDQGLVGTG